MDNQFLITYCSRKIKNIEQVSNQLLNKYIPDQIGIWKCGPAGFEDRAKQEHE